MAEVDENVNYVLEKYIENADGIFKKESQIVVSMDKKQLMAIEGFLHALCQNIEDAGRTIRFSISIAGESESIFMWTSK